MRPTCAGGPETWFSNDPAEKLTAIDACLHQCPMLDACRRDTDQLIASGFPVVGVWAGVERVLDVRARKWSAVEGRQPDDLVQGESVRRRELRDAAHQSRDPKPINHRSDNRFTPAYVALGTSSPRRSRAGRRTTEDASPTSHGAERSTNAGEGDAA